MKRYTKYVGGSAVLDLVRRGGKNEIELFNNLNGSRPDMVEAAQREIEFGQGRYGGLDRCLSLATMMLAERHLAAVDTDHYFVAGEKAAERLIDDAQDMDGADLDKFVRKYGDTQDRTYVFTVRFDDRNSPAALVRLAYSEYNGAHMHVLVMQSGGGYVNATIPFNQSVRYTTRRMPRDCQVKLDMLMGLIRRVKATNANALVGVPVDMCPAPHSGPRVVSVGKVSRRPMRGGMDRSAPYWVPTHERTYQHERYVNVRGQTRTIKAFEVKREYARKLEAVAA